MALKKLHPVTITDFTAFTDEVEVMNPSQSHAQFTETFTVTASLRWRMPVPKKGSTITITVDGDARTVVDYNAQQTPNAGEVVVNRGTGEMIFHADDEGLVASVTTTPFYTAISAEFFIWMQNKIAAGGGGGIAGPVTSTDNALPRFDGVDGETIQNSGVVVDDSNNVSGIAQLNAATLNPTNALALNKGGTGATTSTDARTNLGLGSMATQNSNAVTITGGSVTGSTLVRSTSSIAKTYPINSLTATSNSGSLTIRDQDVFTPTNGQVFRIYLPDLVPGDILTAITVQFADFDSATNRGADVTLRRELGSTFANQLVAGTFNLRATSSGWASYSASFSAHTVLANYVYFLEFTTVIPSALDVFFRSFAITRTTRVL